MRKLTYDELRAVGCVLGLFFMGFQISSEFFRLGFLASLGIGILTPYAMGFAVMGALKLFGRR
jgi:hypothetical protein